MYRDDFAHNQKGIVFLITMVTLLVVVALTNVMLVIITSQPAVVAHQVDRIQAYYAGLSARHYAMECLRERCSPGLWGTRNNFFVWVCRDNQPTADGLCAPCVGGAPAWNLIYDNSLPVSLNCMRVEVRRRWWFDPNEIPSAGLFEPLANRGPLNTRRINIITSYRTPRTLP